MAGKRTMWGPPGGVAGTCMTCGKPARSARSFYCEDHKPATHVAKLKAGTTPDPGASGDDPAIVPDAPGGAWAGDGPPERRPSVPVPTPDKPKGLAARLFGGGGDGGDKAPKATGEKRPAAQRGRRVSTAELWGSAVSPIASVAARAGYVPMARAMVWSSPVAGDIIEDATKGTPIDRLVQPIAKGGEKWQDLFDLLGFWAAIGMAQANPAQAPAALQFARGRLVNLLPRIAKNIKAQRERERDAVEALTELMPDLAELFPDMTEGDDPVAKLIESLFGGLTAQPEPADAT